MPKIVTASYRNALSVAGLANKHDEMLDQFMLTTSDVVHNDLTLTGNLVVDGNTLIKGQQTIIETEVVRIKDALIEINEDNPSPLGHGGIKINRGLNSPAAYFIWDEFTQTPRVGVEGDLKAIATRPDSGSMVNNGIAVWDDAEQQFISTDTIAISTAFTGTLSANQGVFLGTSTSKPNVGGDVLGNMTLTSNSNVEVVLTNPNGKFRIPMNSHFDLGGQAALYSDALGTLHANATKYRLHNNGQLGWNDGNYIVSSTDGNTMRFVAQNIELAASQAIGIAVPLNFGATGSISAQINNVLEITSTGDISLAPGAGGVVRIPSLSINQNMVRFLSDPSGNFTLATDGEITLLPLNDVIIPTSKRLLFGSAIKQVKVLNNDLLVSSDTNIVLSAAQNVQVPNSLQVGATTTVSETGTTTIIANSTGNIQFVPNATSGTVSVPTNTQFNFSPSEFIYSNGNNMVLTSGLDIELSASRHVLIRQNRMLTFGNDANGILLDTANNLTIKSSNTTLFEAPVTLKSNITFYNTSAQISENTLANTLDFTAPVAVTSQSKFQVASTASGTSLSSSAFSVAGTSYFSGTVTTAGQTNVTGTLAAANNALVVQNAVGQSVLTIQNQSNTLGTAIEMLSNWDGNAYTIGRGTNALNGGRAMAFGVPSYDTTYASTGARPAFYFGNPTTQFVTINDQATTVTSGSLIVNSTASDAVVVNGTINTSVLSANTMTVPSSFSATTTAITTQVPIQVQNGMTVISNTDATNVATFTDTGVTLHKPTTVDNSLDVTGDTTVYGTLMTQGVIAYGNIDMTTRKIVGLGAPTSPNDAATKQYVDDAIQGYSFKDTVEAATTNNLDLLQPVFNVDNVTLVPGDRVLIKDQTNPVQNGIYEVQMDNTLQRTLDFQAGDRTTGPIVFVANGDNWDGKGFIAADNNLLIGTDPINWTSFLGLDRINVTTGLGKSGNTLFVNVDNTTIEASPSNELRISSGAFGAGLAGGSGSPITTTSDQSHVTQVGTLTNGTWNAQPVTAQYGGTGLVSPSEGHLVMGSTASALKTAQLIYDETNNRFGIGTTTPTTLLHASEPTTSAMIKVASTNVTPQETGIQFQQTGHAANVKLQGNGSLLISQDDTTSSSRIIFATGGGNSRMEINQTGKVTINTDTPDNNSQLTVNGSASFGATKVNGNLTLGNYATFSPTVSATTETTLTTTRFNVDAPISSQSGTTIGNLTFTSSPTDTSIRSTDAITGLPVPMSLAQTPSFISATAYSAGFHIPHTLLIGGDHVDESTAYKVELVSNKLELTPGMASMLVNFNGDARISKTLEFRDPTASAYRFATYATSDSMYLNSKGSIMNLKIGISGANETVTTIGDTAGTDTVTFDPTLTTTRLTVSDNVQTHLRGEVSLYKSIKTVASGGITATLSNIGWYYVGLLGVGRTTIKASLDWDVVITFDGATNYNVNDRIRSRSAISLIVFKVGISHHLFLYVNTAPIKVTILEAITSNYRLDQYEGSATTEPDGTFSGWDNSWIKDYDLATSQAKATNEVGTIIATSTAQLANLTTTGPTTVNGTLNVLGETSMNGDTHTWYRANGNNIAQLTSDVGFNNNFTLFSQDASSASLTLNRTSRNATISVNSSFSLQNAGALVISHNTANTQSKIVFQTRATPRMTVHDDGHVFIYSTAETTGQNDGALVVSGGFQASKTITTLSQVITPSLVFKNSGSGVITAVSTTSAGDLYMNNKRITQIGSPADDQDAATKAYVDTATQGMAAKSPVTAASAGTNVDISQPVTTLDGVVLSTAGTRFLLKDQANAVENGIWVTVNGAPPERASDLAAGSQAGGATVYVIQGTVNAASGFMCDSVKGSDYVGINALSFVQTTGAGQISVGAGLVKSGNMISIVPDNYSIEVALGALRIKSDSLGQGLSGGSGNPITVSSVAHLDTFGTIRTGEWQGTVIDMQYGGTGSAAFTANAIPFSNGLKLTQGPLVFDATNVRLGINTTTPTHGLTMLDRTFQLTQTAANPCYILTTSTNSNFSFATRQSGTDLIWSNGAGQDPTTLTDRMVLDNTGVLRTNYGLVTPFATVNSNYRFTGNAHQRMNNGAMNMQYYSNDNSGTYLTLYGGLGTFSSTTNAEFMRIGYYNTQYTIQTATAGSGTTKALSLQSGTNTDQIILNTDGSVTINGLTTVTSTTSATSTTSGALQVAGGVGIQGDLYAQTLNLTSTSDTAIQLGGGLALSTQLTLNGTVAYKLYSHKTANNVTFTTNSAATPTIVQLTTYDQNNTQDNKIRVFGKGDITTSTGAEYLTLGFDATSTTYQVMTKREELSGTIRPLVLGAGTTQLTLDPTSGMTTAVPSTFTSSVTLSSTQDAASTTDGGALTVSGGLAVAKTIIVGYGISTPAIHVTNEMEFSAAGSIDRTKVKYTSTGNLNFYNTQETAITIHGGNSGGPSATNQEYMKMGYNDATSYTIRTGKAGLGVSTSLVLQSGTNTNQLVLNTNNSITSNGNLQVANTTNSTSTTTGALQVVGGVGIQGNVYLGNGININEDSTTNDLINLTASSGNWKLKNDTVNTRLALTPTSTGQDFAITDSTNATILGVNQSTGETSINAKTSVQVNALKAFLVKNAGNTDLFWVDTINAIVNAGGCRIINVADPEIATDVANKRYVDSVAKGLNLKFSVTATNVEAQNVNLLNPVLSLDGVALQPGNRVLLRSQTDPVQNGIYTVQTGNYLVRASDMDNGSTSTGAFTFVEMGNAYAERGFVVSTDPPNNIVGTDPITWTQFNGNVISAGMGLYKDGNNVLHVLVDPDSVIDIGPAGIRLNPSSIGSGLNLNSGVLSVTPPTDLGIVTQGTWRATPVEMSYGGTGSTSFPANTIVFSTGSVLANDVNNFLWNNTKKTLSVGTTLADPNTNNEGITTTKDIAIYGTTPAFLLGDNTSTPTYNWSMRKTTAGHLMFAGGTATTKTNLTDHLVLLNSGNIGVGYLEANVANITSTFDINGTMRVTGAVTLDTKLTVSNGGTGASSIPYGLILANGTSAFTSTGAPNDGAIPIGTSGNQFVLESGATLRAHIGLAIGTNVQAHNANLDAISALAPANNAFILGNGTEFTVASGTSARTALGLGDLATLSTINNTLWSGAQLTVANGGTNNTSFTASTVPYYNSTTSAIESTNVFYDVTTGGLGVGTNVVTTNTAIQVYGKDLSIQTDDNTNTNNALNFQNANGQFVWRMRRQDTGAGTGAAHLVLSGGVPSSSRTALIDAFSLRSDGTTRVHSTVDATTTTSASLVVSGGLGVNGSVRATTTNSHVLVSTNSTANAPTVTIQNTSATSTSSLVFQNNTGADQLKVYYDNATNKSHLTSTTQQLYLSAPTTHVTATTMSTSVSNGSMVVAGGVGITGALHLGDNLQTSISSSTGAYMTVANDIIFTDNTTATSTSSNAFKAVHLGGPNLDATNTSVTFPTATTLYIQGPPTINPATTTTPTITDAYAVWIAEGKSRFDGVVQLTSTSDQSMTLQGGITVAKDVTLTGGKLTTETGTSVIKSLQVQEIKTGAYTSLSKPAKDGFLLDFSPTTVEDTSTPASSTHSKMSMATMVGPTLTATNTSVTYTTASTLHLTSPPSAGTNVTITKRRTLFVETGTTELGGTVMVTNTSDATSSSDGSLHTDGGASVAKTLFVGNDIIVGGNVYATGNISSPTVTIPPLSLTNTSSVTPRRAKLIKDSATEMRLSVVFEVLPQAANVPVTFNFELPEKVNNITTDYDLVATVSGWYDNAGTKTKVYNDFVAPTTGTTEATVSFESNSSTAHFINVIVDYTV